MHTGVANKVVYFLNDCIRWVSQIERDSDLTVQVCGISWRKQLSALPESFFVFFPYLFHLLDCLIICRPRNILSNKDKNVRL